MDLSVKTVGTTDEDGRHIITVFIQSKDEFVAHKLRDKIDNEIEKIINQLKKEKPDVEKNR